MSRNISHYVQTLHNEPFNEIRGTVGIISDWVSENSILWQYEDSAEKMCQIVIINHNSARHENLNICIFWYFYTSQTTKILEFISSYFTTDKVRDVFLKTPLFGKKWNVIFIWLGSTISHTVDWVSFGRTFHISIIEK